MATKRLDMYKTKEILRLKWGRGLKHREIARSLAISAGSVGATVSRAKRAGLDLPKVEQLDDDALEALNRALNQFAIYFENRLPV